MAAVENLRRAESQLTFFPLIVIIIDTRIAYCLLSVSRKVT